MGVLLNSCSTISMFSKCLSMTSVLSGYMRSSASKKLTMSEVLLFHPMFLADPALRGVGEHMTIHSATSGHAPETT